MPPEPDPRLPCVICGQPLATQPERGCLAMTCDMESLIVSELVVCCLGACLKEHDTEDASILCDEDLASYLGPEGAGARARLMATFGWTETAAREYLSFAREARVGGDPSGASARLAS